MKQIKELPVVGYNTLSGDEYVLATNEATSDIKTVNITLKQLREFTRKAILNQLDALKPALEALAAMNEGLTALDTWSMTEEEQTAFVNLNVTGLAPRVRKKVLNVDDEFVNPADTEDTEILLAGKTADSDTVYYIIGYPEN